MLGKNVLSVSQSISAYNWNSCTGFSLTA